MLTRCGVKSRHTVHIERHGERLPNLGWHTAFVLDGLENLATCELGELVFALKRRSRQVIVVVDSEHALRTARTIEVEIFGSGDLNDTIGVFKLDSKTDDAVFIICKPRYRYGQSKLIRILPIHIPFIIRFFFYVGIIILKNCFCGFTIISNSGNEDILLRSI